MTRTVSTTAIIAAFLLAACATTGGETELTAEAADQAPAMTNAQMRAEAAKLEPMARGTFWSSEWEKNPADREAALEFSRALREIGSAAKAGAIADQGLTYHPGDVELLLALAAARLDEGRPPAAVGPLERAIAAAPSDWRAYSILGVALDQAGQHGQAVGRYQQALAVSPDNPAILTNLGMSYAVAGDLDAAEATLRQAVAQPDAGAQARQNLSLVLAYQGRFDEAEQLALVDLPPQVAHNNIEYARSMVTRPRRWEDLRR